MARRHQFTGENPGRWVDAIESYFEEHTLPEDEAFVRATRLLSADVNQVCRRKRAEYPRTWEGIKSFVMKHCGTTTLALARDRLSQVRWKGCPQLLMTDVEKAANMWPELTEAEKLQVYIGRLPERVRSMWPTLPDDGTMCGAYEKAKTILERFHTAQQVSADCRSLDLAAATARKDRKAVARADLRSADAVAAAAGGKNAPSSKQSGSGKPKSGRTAETAGAWP